MVRSRKPLPLRKGDVIAIFAPAGPVDGKKLSRGVARLASAGYVPEISGGVGKIPRRPRLVSAYSDVTAILAYLSTRLRIPSLHGPMAAADLARKPDGAALAAFSRLAAGAGVPPGAWGVPL